MHKGSLWTLWNGIIRHHRNTTYVDAACRYGYQSTGHSVISSHSHVVTWSTRHRSTRHTRISSQSQLATSEHITKPPVYSRNYLHAIRRNPATVLNSKHRWHNYHYMCYFNVYCSTAQYRSRRQITVLWKALSTRHNAMKHERAQNKTTSIQS